MDSDQINKIARKNNRVAKHFLGVFAIDQLPQYKIEKKPASLIINLCKRDIIDDACHWVSLFVTKNKTLYFDSGSAELSLVLNPEIQIFCKNQNQDAFGNIFQYQSFTSNYCGLFALTFIFALSHKISFEDYLEQFSVDNLNYNDTVLEKLFFSNYCK
jgi:hypothetical protein